MSETTNLASSLEGVNEVYGTIGIVAEDTHQFAQDMVEARELDVVLVAGKREPVRIFERLGPAGSVESGMLAMRSLHQKAHSVPATGLGHR